MDSSIVDRPPRPQRLTESVAGYVRALVMAGEILPGNYVRISQIVNALDVSSTPVREALLGLCGEGLLELEAGRGFRVLPLGRGDIEDIFRLQGWIAGELAAAAAVRISVADLDRLTGYHLRMDTAVRAGEPYEVVEALNHAFHDLTNTTAQSSKLEWFLELTRQFATVSPAHEISISGRTVDTPPQRVAGWLEASSAEHEAILRALRAGDPDEARKTTSEHVAHSGQLLTLHLSAWASWPPADDPSGQRKVVQSEAIRRRRSEGVAIPRAPRSAELTNRRVKDA